MKSLAEELKVLLTAVMFLTRIPCPSWLDHSPDRLNRSARWFPAVGLLVGAWGALVYWTAAHLMPLPLAVLLSMIATILLTGGFHEDGLADTCDAFGGGWIREQVLTIMKDSRVGSYGVLGLVLMLALKFLSLSWLPAAAVVPLLVCGHAISRLVACSIIFSCDYSRDDDSSKSKPLARSLGAGGLLFASVCGLTPFLLLPPLMALAIPLVLLFRQFWIWYLRRRIGGYTGDALGAAQQISEAIVYLTAVVVVWKS